MPARRVNPGRIKLHHSYTVGEVAERLGVHKNTVRQWRREGLTSLDATRPLLFHGGTLRAFLTARQARRRDPCGPGRFYCFGCRAPRPPAEGMVDFLPLTPRSGNLRALCGACGTLMHRRAARTALGAVMPGIAVRMGQAP